MYWEHSWGPPIVVMGIWSAIWTGFALWHAARREEKGWFIFFLLVHTAGIVEILYLLLVVKAFNTSKHSSKRRR